MAGFIEFCHFTVPIHYAEHVAHGGALPAVAICVVVVALRVECPHVLGPDPTPWYPQASSMGLLSYTISRK